MGTILKLFAVVVVVGGIWFWASGRSVTDEVEAQSKSVNLSASAILAPNADSGAFDKEGTIVLDMTQGPNGTPYILYTEYSEHGKPSVKTKRLVFQNRDECAEANLACATNQPGFPVRPDEKVRVVGVAQDEKVDVMELYRL